MSKTRIKLNTILNNQFPSYVKEEFPLVVEFLRQYYVSQEIQGAPFDLIQNIDQYIKLDNIKSKSKSTTLIGDISLNDEVINVSSTFGFPDSYGLIKIDDEIITYRTKTQNSFVDCVRGFSGVTSYKTQNSPDELVFESTEASDHTSGVEVINLSTLFFEEFLSKIKYQIAPGFEGRKLNDNVDQYLFLKQSKDFYSTKGTDTSFKILFKVLYGENVEVIKPQEYMVKPSSAGYKVTNDLVVEVIEGNPEELVNSTLYQDSYGEIITKGFASIAYVEKIYSLEGKEYYKLSFDSGYNKDINVDGSLYGSFSIHPKTKLIGDVESGSTTLDVDSTVGFPESGELTVKYYDDTAATISYTSKSLTQFFGCSNITNKILDSSDICLNIFAYGKSNKENSSEIIKVRVTSILDQIDLVDDTYYQSTGDDAIIRTLGISKQDFRFDNWIFNLSTSFEVKSIELIDVLNKIYKISTFLPHNLRKGDSVSIIGSNDTSNKLNVIDVISETQFSLGIRVELSTTVSYKIKRLLNKVNHSVYTSLSNINSDIQNIYRDKDNILVSSSSLPFYSNQSLDSSDRSITFSGTFSGDTFKITSSKDHGFYTGDSVYYTSSELTSQPLFDDGIYFIKRVDSYNVKFSRSRSDLYNSKFITIDTPLVIVSDKLILQEFYSKSLVPQNILRQINPPTNDGNLYSTSPGPIGILINGTEILNYKSKDKIYYGPIENIDVVSGGTNYDVIDPPCLDILDSVGFGATGYCSVIGNLTEIRLVDPGFDYVSTPQIRITGGNGVGAKASPIMKSINYEVSFNSEQKYGELNLSNDTIGFSTYHKFRNGEKIRYVTNNQTGVGGISTNAEYYAKVKNSYTISIHKEYNDAIVGINTINLTSYGVGRHTFKCINKKYVISSINIIDSGSGYQNKKRTASTSGINTATNIISIKNHGYNSGEIVRYSTDGTSANGLTNNSDYYVTKVNNDSFRLSLVGVQTYSSDFYYSTKQYINLKTAGSGTHYFNYQPITVEVIGDVGISSVSGTDFKAIIKPVFRGEISSFHLKSGGKFYGSPEVLNYYRDPLLSLRQGNGAELVPIVNNGKIVEVLVNNSGNDYNTTPDIQIEGDGFGAVLIPIVVNGEIKEVKIINAGSQYTQSNTSLRVASSGTGAKFSSTINSWTVNLVRKNLNSLTSDDGCIFYNSYTKGNLQYSHLYAPRKLRESIYSNNSLGNPIYGTFDLSKVNGKEVSSTKHSPIIGWAYDGNPIYGPYGYTKKNADNGGSISQMKSGYKLITSAPETRPETSIYPLGFFAEDYVYQTSTDDTILDQNNGRFCVTPEFPNGVYAYFSTFDQTVASGGVFKNYKSPAFPYFVGDSFKSLPIEFNFKVTSNQEDVDLNKTNWLRNTRFYNLLKDNTSYDYLNLPNKLDQICKIKYASSGNIESVGIITGGNNYKIGDTVISDESNTNGYGFFAEVSEIGGRKITSVTSENITRYDAEIYPNVGKKGLFDISFDLPHDFKTGDIVSISGINTALSIFKDYYITEVYANTLSIKNPFGIASTSVTGIVTYISVGGNLSNVRENDIYSIGSEKIKVLNIDKPSSRLRVLRSYDNTVGSSHSYTEILYEIPRRLSINSNEDLSYDYSYNREIYFNPNESIGLGTSTGVGIGTTLFLSNPGVGATFVFVPTRAIFLPKHGLRTGDEVVYSSNGETPIGISTDGKGSGALLQDQSTIYISKLSDDLVGISSVRVGLGSTGTFVGIASTTRNKSILFLMSDGTGTNHSFKTKLNSLKGNIIKNKVTVSTAETHGLLDNDVVFVDVKPGISTTITIIYNDFHRMLLVNPKSFSSVGINTVKNTITIENHGYKTGQKVIHNSSSVVLENNGDYYVTVVDKDTIRLAKTYYDATQSSPLTVGITSAYSGTLSLVNPPIPVYRNSTILFDLSDASLSYSVSNTKYSAFNFNLYVDSNFTNTFESSKNQRIFEIKRSGIIGITSDAKISLSLNDNIPDKLFYKLDPIYNSSIPSTKSQISIDSTVQFNNELQIQQSLYNGRHKITSISPTSFQYLTKDKQESDYYDQTNSDLSYKTVSSNAYGPISKVNILSKGQNYSKLPKFLEVSSEFGFGAILKYDSNSIGKIKKIKKNSVGFDFACDFTVRPNLSLPQVLKIEPLASIESIKINSVGNGYIYPPKLILLDGVTKNVVKEADFEYSFSDTYVTILKNTYGINDVTPTIIPTKNSNGVGISSIVYDSITNNVTVTLSVGFSTENTFPFELNDRVLIENISVGINSTGKGFNSEDYNYQLFTLTGVSENLGGIGIVTYSLNNLLSEGEYPGIFDPLNSYGRIIPEKYFPKFEVNLKKNNYLMKEDVRYLGENDSVGYVESVENKNDYIRVLSRDYLKEGLILQGQTSKTQGLISKVISPNSSINLAAYSKFENGWQSEVGFLNDTLQKIQDSFYYQNFSYSLKSKVPYDTWEEVVGSLNHTLGFKKFSDYQCEPSLQEVNDNSLFPGYYAGISTSRMDTSTDLIGVANLNCYYDFDLARENSYILNSNVLSSEIYFASKILTDYYESISNRVLSIDDFSSSFYNLPRTRRYLVVSEVNTTNIQSQKYITLVKDRRYFDQKQLMLVTLVHGNDDIAYINQYGRVESSYDLGSFDFLIENSNQGKLLFYPNKSLWNDYDVTTLSYNIKDSFVGIASTSFGNVVYIDSEINKVSSSTTSIVSIGTTFTSVKAIVEIAGSNGQYQFNEFSAIHNGVDVQFIDYGQLITNSTDNNPLYELGSFNAYLSGSKLNVDFSPVAGIAVTINSIQVSIANTASSGVGTYYMEYSKIEGRSTLISSSPTPTYNVIAEYSDFYNGGYFIVQLTDKTNNTHQLSELIVVNDSSQSYDSEFSVLQTGSGIGSIRSIKTANSTQILFLPNPNINVDVKVYSNTIKDYLDPGKESKFNDETLVNDYDVYYGAAVDIKRTFDLNHRGNPIFKRYFDGSSSDVVDIDNSVITIENHFFVSGEEVIYSSGLVTEINSPIGITTTDFGVGIGITDKLPSKLFVVKMDQNRIKLAKTAENALKFNPETLDITSTGIGTNHNFTSKNQNSKALITIDNIIQSPLVSTSTTTILSNKNLKSEDIIYVNSTSNIFSGDLLKIDNEIMRVESVGVGSTNSIRVNRPWLGTILSEHLQSSNVVKLVGDYNIVDNQIHFVTAPYGEVPIGSVTNPPDERDWEYINTNSTFYGRTFMRSGPINGTEETYSRNYIFDDISNKFNGTNNTFSLTQNGSNVSNVLSSIVLINDVFQEEGINSAYTLDKQVGITSIKFVGSGTSLSADINTSNLPAGGIIVSVGSTSGFGYQPLVCAGGTAIVSSAGTISAISIGNSGSGYRKKIQTLYETKDIVVRVGVATSSLENYSIQFIGTASVSNGNIVSVAITNPGVGYTQSNPPFVIFDSPLSYSDIPLVYSSSSSGVGTQASIDIVVGQGSSVIDFEIKNLGYGYKSGDILTVSTNNIVGIPTVSNSSFKEFQIQIQRTFTDKFVGWSVGEFQLLDSFQTLFDGKKVIFPIKYQGELVSILSAKGSNIVIRDNLLVFINDVIQVPGESYVFDGGSSIKFNYAPREGDTCRILFYKGSGDIDVPFRNVLETVKIGDEVKLSYDASIGQKPYFEEDPRTVFDIKSIDLIETNPYFGPGNTTDDTLIRPLLWCKQTEDKIINQKGVSKDRILYEASIVPSSYITNSVGIGSTVIYVDSIIPFFNQTNENVSSLDFQKNVSIVSQDLVVSAAATAVVSTAGTISSISISTGGYGYKTAPKVTIQNPIGIGSTTSTAIASITSGIVTSISIIKSVSGYSKTNPPIVLIEPPAISSEKDVVDSYSGDFGIIAGIGTTSVGIASTGIVFNFFIPIDSPLRNSLITGVTTISGIKSDYYFVITDSNVGNGFTSFDKNKNRVGIGTSFLDGVYNAVDVSIEQSTVIGVGLTYVAKVVVSVSKSNTDSLVGIAKSNYYGKFSWGRINLKNRQKKNSYNAYTLNGYSGISTGSLVNRVFPLRFSDYKV